MRRTGSYRYRTYCHSLYQGGISDHNNLSELFIKIYTTHMYNHKIYLRVWLV